MFRGKKVAIVLSEIYLHPCDLYRTNTTYFDSSLRHALNSWWQQLLGKTYGLRFQNRAMFIHNFVYSTAQKMNFSIKDFFSKRDQINLQETADLVAFTGEILNRKIHFSCIVGKLRAVERMVSLF